MSTTTIIQRRDLEPLWAKAGEIARHYEKAGNCVSALMGADYVSIEPSNHPKYGLFCSLCKRFNSDAQESPVSDSPCLSMHSDAVKQAIRLGGSYVYTCALGFYFWTSPFFSMERFAGAFLASGAIAIEREQVIERVFSACKENVSREEIAGYLEGTPEKTVLDIEAMAQMLMLCAERISCRKFSRDYMPDDDEAGSQSSLLKGYLPTFIDRERLLLANLRRGDSAEAQVIARDLLTDLRNALSAAEADSGAGGAFEFLKLKAIELVVLLSRAGATEEKNEALVEASCYHLKRVKESKNETEIIDNFCLVVERMAGKIFSFQGVRHASALRKAERYIWENYTRKVSLKEIADVSQLSAPYFSTIFKDEMGENLSDYLNQLRVEKATMMLRETDLLISQISSACGFEDQSWFSKIFKNHTGISPCKYRRTVGVTPLEQNLSNRQGK